MVGGVDRLVVALFGVQAQICDVGEVDASVACDRKGTS